MRSLLFALLLLCLAAAGAPAQTLKLAARGGSYPGNLQLVVGNGQMGGVAIVLLGVDTGPTPIAPICPGDTRLLRLGTRFLDISFRGPMLPPKGEYRSAPLPVPNDPGLKGATLFWHAFSLGLSGCPVGNLSNATATRFFPKNTFQDRSVTVGTSRSFQSVILLPDQRYMMIGGGQGGILAQIATKSSEIYDPVTDAWTPGPIMSTEHSIHTTTRLKDGRWLIAGGVDIQNRPQSATELYDPKSNRFASAAPMLFKRAGHDAVRLPNGKVWVSGGYEKNTAVGGNILAPILTALKETEFYDAAANKWSRGPDMSVPRIGHRVIPLPNGKYLLYGGIGWFKLFSVKIPAIWKDCDLYDPATNTITPAAKMRTQRAIAPWVDLGGGKFLISGGVSKISLTNPGQPTNTAEIYDASTGKWTATGSLSHARGLHWGFPLGGGKYIHIGGADNSVLKPRALQTTEVYDAATGKWTLGPRLNVARAAYGSLQTPNGQIYVISGGTGSSAINTRTTEWFYP